MLESSQVFTCIEGRSGSAYYIVPLAIARITNRRSQYSTGRARYQVEELSSHIERSARVQVFPYIEDRASTTFINGGSEVNISTSTSQTHDKVKRSPATSLVMRGVTCHDTETPRHRDKAQSLYPLRFGRLQLLLLLLLRYDSLSLLQQF